MECAFSDTHTVDNCQKLHLVVFADGSVEIVCEVCIQAGASKWEIGTKIYAIGDDVTHYYI